MSLPLPWSIDHYVAYDRREIIRVVAANGREVCQGSAAHCGEISDAVRHLGDSVEEKTRTLRRAHALVVDQMEAMRKMYIRRLGALEDQVYRLMGEKSPVEEPEKKRPKKEEKK